MVRITEEILKQWADPASDSEENRCDRTINSIKSCISTFDFGALGIPDVILRGSYKNNTNVRRDSDVDMYVLFDNFSFSCNSYFKPLPVTGNPGPNYNEFKNAIYNCLQQKYGYSDVSKGRKSIKIKSNNYRVDADVVPVTKLFYYSNYGSSEVKGVAFFSSNGEFIVNFPVQDNDNGCIKNNNTNHRYKHMVRIFKRFRNELENNKQISSHISSYVIESLLYNVPDNYFNGESYVNMLINIVHYLYQLIGTTRFSEVNRIKEMFRPDLFPEQTNTKMEVKEYLGTMFICTLEERAA